MNIEYKTSDGLVPYEEAIAFMEARVDAIIKGDAPELIWFLEHPPLYTSGTSAKPSDLLHHELPVYAAGRGGEYTYHGPGQLVAYVMLNLKARNQMDVRAYVARLENWIIATLKEFGVESFTREGRIGVWVEDNQKREAKIAALGIRIRKWVTYHGISINVNPDLSHYAGIVPCGINEFGVTSLEKLGVLASIKTLRQTLQENAEFQLSLHDKN